VTRTEFLKQLRDALLGEIDNGAVQDNIDYYNSYIEGETAKGRSESEVLDELGDPRLIARTIIDTAEAGGSASPEGFDRGESAEDGGYRSAGPSAAEEERPDAPFDGPHLHTIDFSKWYVRLIAAIVVFFALFLLFTILGGIFALLFKFAGPILLILLCYLIIRSLFT
jgi:hypothetical protein